MDLTQQLLDSWDRQCRIVDAVTSLIGGTNRHFKPADDSMAIDSHLAHMHNTRRFFLSQVAPDQVKDVPSAYADKEGTPLADLDAIKACLKASGTAVRRTVEQALATGGPMKSEHVTYDNPVLFLQHMVWHDGWHVGMIFLALRRNGQEPPEEWEEPNVWGLWRTETW